jgi:hypothetical protein
MIFSLPQHFFLCITCMKVKMKTILHWLRIHDRRLETIWTMQYVRTKNVLGLLQMQNWWSWNGQEEGTYCLVQKASGPNKSKMIWQKEKGKLTVIVVTCLQIRTVLRMRAIITLWANEYKSDCSTYRSVSSMRLIPFMLMLLQSWKDIRHPGIEEISSGLFLGPNIYSFSLELETIAIT